MAKRNQIRALLSGLDAGDPRYRQHIAFGQLTLSNRRERLRFHANAGLGRRQSCGDRFLGDIHNVRPARFVEVGQAI